jgi:acetylornithine deacetylase
MQFALDDQYILDTLVELVQIDSRNPLLDPAAPGEAEIAAYVAEAMAGVGLDVAVAEVQPGRPNVVGRLAGAGGGRSLLLNGHTDTVGVEGMAEPFSAAVRDGRLYGRGSYDMKASLAAILGAVKALSDANVTLAGDLVVAMVIDEEHSSLGSEYLCQHVKCDGAIVAEPTDLALCRAHRGFIWYRVETFGRAAHGSHYQEGIDANLHMGRVLVALDSLAHELVQRDPHPLMGPPSLHAALLEGGTELSTYAAQCVLQFERRIIAGETEAQCTGELQAILDRLSAEDQTFSATLSSFFRRDPFAVPADAPIVQSVDRAALEVLGERPEHIGQPFWTDAGLTAGAGMETVVIGPVGRGLHSAEEWVELESVHRLAHILAATALDYCGKLTG